jgi:5'-phosphate synthase pdxT subunit
MPVSRLGVTARSSLPPVGVLALQGDFERHRTRLVELGASVRLVRSAVELDAVCGLVIPGGESTTMSTLLGPESLEPFRQFASSRPVLGTCAGAILLAREIVGSRPGLGVIDISVRRNAYGRQIDSSIRTGVLDGVPTELVFIRAPRIVRVGPGVEVLVRDGLDPALVRQGLALAATFHPELGTDHRVHALFLQIVRAAAAAGT